MPKFCDVTNNGQIDIGDAQYIAAYLAGLPGYDIPRPALVDANGNGDIDIGDAQYIAAYLVKLPGYDIPDIDVGLEPEPEPEPEAFSTDVLVKAEFVAESVYNLGGGLTQEDMMIISAKAINSEKNIVAFDFRLDSSGISALVDNNFLPYNVDIENAPNLYSKLLNWEVVNKNFSFGLINGYTVIREMYETIPTTDYKVLLRIPCDYYSELTKTTLVSDIPGHNWNVEIVS